MDVLTTLIHAFAATMTILAVEMEYFLEPGFNDFMCGATNRLFVHSARSPVECAASCSTTSGCKSVITYEGNSTCYGLKNGFSCINTRTDLMGAKFYRKVAALNCSGNKDLVSGSVGVKDEQFTASSSRSVFKPWEGRLAYGWHWEAGSSDTAPWLQVDFLGTRKVYKIQTLGAGSGYDNMIKTFTIKYSLDCVSFETVVDASGDVKNFTGGWESGALKINNFPTPVFARCVRICSRTTVDGLAALRMTLNGC